MKFSFFYSIFILLILLLTVSCSKEAQDEHYIDDVLFNNASFRPNWYDEISGSQITLVWQDLFSNNNKNWKTGKISDNCSAEIKSDVYTIKNFEKDYAYDFVINSDIDISTDYQVVSNVKVSNKNGGGLIVSNGNDYIVFLVSSDKKYTIQRFENSQYDEIKAWSSINTDFATSKFNDLCIRHIDGSYYFYINKSYTGIKCASRGLGKEVGFFVNPGSTLTVENIKVSYIKI